MVSLQACFSSLISTLPQNRIIPSPFNARSRICLVTELAILSWLPRSQLVEMFIDLSKDLTLTMARFFFSEKGYSWPPSKHATLTRNALSVSFFQGYTGRHDGGIFCSRPESYWHLPLHFQALCSEKCLQTYQNSNVNLRRFLLNCIHRCCILGMKQDEGTAETALQYHRLACHWTFCVNLVLLFPAHARTCWPPKDVHIRLTYQKNIWCVRRRHCIHHKLFCYHVLAGHWALDG